jgi:hypothetical protein
MVGILRSLLFSLMGLWTTFWRLRRNNSFIYHNTFNLLTPSFAAVDRRRTMRRLAKPFSKCSHIHWQSKSKASVRNWSSSQLSPNTLKEFSNSMGCIWKYLQRTVIHCQAAISRYSVQCLSQTSSNSYSASQSLRRDSLTAAQFSWCQKCCGYCKSFWLETILCFHQMNLPAVNQSHCSCRQHSYV